MNPESSREAVPPLSDAHPDDDVIERLRYFAQNERGEPLTWGPTPLTMDPTIRIQQGAVQAQLDPLFRGKNVPEYISKDIAEYISNLNSARTFRRAAKNQDSYAYRKKTDVTGLPLEILTTIELATSGHASPAELLYIAQLLGIPTIELASLTIPYGQRLDEHLPTMRGAVTKAIQMHEGTLASQRPQFEVKGADNVHDPSQMKALHMTRKVLVGTLPDETYVIERSSFVVLLDRLPEGYAEHIRDIPYNENWAKQVRRANGFYKLVPELLRENHRDVAVPVSITTVAINEELESELLTEDAVRERQRQTIAQHAINHGDMLYTQHIADFSQLR